MLKSINCKITIVTIKHFHCDMKECAVLYGLPGQLVRVTFCSDSNWLNMPVPHRRLVCLGRSLCDFALLLFGYLYVTLKFKFTMPAVLDALSCDDGAFAHDFSVP